MFGRVLNKPPWFTLIDFEILTSPKLFFLPAATPVRPIFFFFFLTSQFSILHEYVKYSWYLFLYLKNVIVGQPENFDQTEICGPLPGKSL